MKVSVRPARPPATKRSAAPKSTHQSNLSRCTEFPVFIAHADVPSARHAMTRLGLWLRQTRPACRLLPMLWRFDQLGDPHWQKMATPDLSRAAALVIALKKDSGPGPELEAWLSLIAKRARGRTVSAMVLIDGEETWTVSLQHLPPKAATVSALPAREAMNCEDNLLVSAVG